MIGIPSNNNISNYFMDNNGKTIFSNDSSEQLLLSITNNSIRPIKISERM